MQRPHLSQTDPDIAQAVDREIRRQQNHLELIASENIVSEAVLEALGTPLTNKYSEGYPRRRYYGGNEIVDVIEQTAIDRAKRLFNAEHANVQPHAGAQANLAAFLALMDYGDTFMAMDLAHGGHLTHGSGVNVSGKAYKAVHYAVSKDSERIDMDMVRELARAGRPKVIVAGYTAYPRAIDFNAFRAIAEEVDAYLMVDMAHIAGLVAAGIHQSPVPHADVVTSTTHKTLRGPRGAMILCTEADRLRPDGTKTLAQRVDAAVFPGMQGGPLEHCIAAKAVAFHEAAQPSFVEYQRQVCRNAAALADALANEGLRIVAGGTDTHMVLADLTPFGIGGKAAEHALDSIGIITNKNLIPFDTRKPLDPSGLRLGTPALTTRGMKEDDMHSIAETIGAVLRDPGNELVLRDGRRVVQQLTEAYPIYGGLVG